jgi:hypothetical protein
MYESHLDYSSLEPESQPESDTNLSDERRVKGFSAEQMGGFDKEKFFYDDFWAELVGPKGP